MPTVTVHYSHRVGDCPDFAEFSEESINWQDTKKILRNYPWTKEARWNEAREENSCIQFTQGDERSYARYTITPVNKNKARLTLDIILIPGLFGSVLGRRSLTINFGLIWHQNLPKNILDLFKQDLEDLYATHLKHPQVIDSRQPVIYGGLTLLGVFIAVTLYMGRNTDLMLTHDAMTFFLTTVLCLSLTPTFFLFISPLRREEIFGDDKITVMRLLKGFGSSFALSLMLLMNLPDTLHPVMAESAERIMIIKDVRSTRYCRGKIFFQGFVGGVCVGGRSIRNEVFPGELMSVRGSQSSLGFQYYSMRRVSLATGDRSNR